MKQKSVGFVGAGNMGSAIVSGIHQDYQVYITDPDKKKCRNLVREYQVQSLDLQSLLSQSDIIILAVKPQIFDELLTTLQPFITKKHLVVSIAAGITIDYITKRIGTHCRVVRTMPNLPAQVQFGVTAICAGSHALKKDLGMVKKIFNCVGTTVVVQEKEMDGITAVSGSGPAYVFFFIECLMAAARSLGFEQHVAQQLVRQTLKGSLELLESAHEDAATLRQRVTSRGGTTQAALDVLHAGQMALVYKNAIKAARKRAKELSQ
ncbi:MAG: pyrroline-5-carboxylate reductase [Candidatus Omnitrophica bacterium]|nr:pyrroline-5-carboxylate reductase [Candidatus Omnitrophota bacterium]